MAPDAGFTSVSDINEFTKFTKFLAYKGVQVIVESRKGIKILPSTKPQTTDTDWFNLNIPDSSDVNQATKNVLPSDRVLETLKSQLHVEISVQTEDGDELVLELWTLSLDDVNYDATLKAMTTIYFRMGILLKSLITVTRIAPAYKLSRIQDSESFTVFYRVYTGEPQAKILGESVKKTQAGLLKTPVGGLCFTVLYRTDFCISPNKTDKTKILMLKSDHFELSPKHIIYESRKKKVEEEKRLKSETKPVDVTKLLTLPAFVDESQLRKVIADFFARVPVPKCRANPNPRPQSPPRPKTESKSTQNVNTSMVSKNPISFEMPPKKFAGPRNENEPPLKMLYFPFADNHPMLELAEFYKDLFNAPKLKLTEVVANPEYKAIEAPKGNEQQVKKKLSDELQDYENSMHEFDELLAEMCRSTEWSI